MSQEIPVPHKGDRDDREAMEGSLKDWVSQMVKEEVQRATQATKVQEGPSKPLDAWERAALSKSRYDRERQERISEKRAHRNEDKVVPTKEPALPADTRRENVQGGGVPPIPLPPDPNWFPPPAAVGTIGQTGYFCFALGVPNSFADWNCLYLDFVDGVLVRYGTHQFVGNQPDYSYPTTDSWADWGSYIAHVSNFYS